MFKEFDLRNDISSREQTLFENVPIYGTGLAPANAYFGDSYTRKYDNSSFYHISSSLSGYLGFYQTIFDQTPVTSPVANALADITYGMSTGSTNYATTIDQRDQKNYIYKIFASTLLGSTTREFAWAGQTFTDLVFVTIKRNVFKDYLRPQNIYMWISASSGSGVGTGMSVTLTASDSCSSNYLTDYAGTYGPILSCSTGQVCGLAFYNAGVIAISSGAFFGPYFSGAWHMNDLITGSSLDHLVDGIRGHLHHINIHPATRVHSTAYKCVLLDKEFNYSSNPTYTDSNGLIRVMSGSLNLTPREARIYITTIGLYDDLGRLLCVGKLSYPVCKNPQESLIFTLRTDF